MNNRTVLFKLTLLLILLIVSAGFISWYNNYNETAPIVNGLVAKSPEEDVFKKEYIKSMMMKVTGWQLKKS